HLDRFGLKRNALSSLGAEARLRARRSRLCAGRSDAALAGVRRAEDRWHRRAGAPGHRFARDLARAAAARFFGRSTARGSPGMTRLRFLTAGESHGPALVGILDGLPAG